VRGEICLRRAATGGLCLLLAGCGAAQPGPDAAGPAPPAGLHVPVSMEGKVIGDVSGDLEVEPSPDGRSARVIAHGPDLRLRFDSTLPSRPRASSVAVVPARRVAVDLGGGHVVARFDLCLDRAVVSIALRRLGGEAPAAPATVSLGNKPFTVDGIALCFADGDVSTPFFQVALHWDAPDGTRIFLEGTVKDLADRGDAKGMPEGLRLRSAPPKPEAAILALLLLGA
jgi:hypothetical protein